MLSLNDHPDIREVFRDYYIKDVEVQYSVSKGGCGQFNELLISNYDLNKVRPSQAVQMTLMDL